MTDITQNHIEDKLGMVTDITKEVIEDALKAELIGKADGGYYIKHSSLEGIFRFADLQRQREASKVPDVLNEALTFSVMVLAFLGRDQGTERIDTTINGLIKEAREIESKLRIAMLSAAPTKQKDGE